MIPVQKYKDILELPVLKLALIHAVLAAPTFGNLCMMISPFTLLCFLCSSGYRMSLSHIPITYLECVPFFSVFNYAQKNSRNTVKFNLPRSDIVWCEKPNVDVVK